MSASTPLVLGIDTCGHACSAALVDAQGNAAFAQTQWMARGHGAALPALMAQALIGRDPASVRAVVVTHGPGGFTGMRAGLAYARAFALGAGIPAFGISVDQALSLSLPQDTPIAIDSRRGDFFLGREIVTVGAVEAFDQPVAGSWSLPLQTPKAGWHEPCPAAMATYGWSLIHERAQAEPDTLEPLYIRAPSVG